MYTLALAEPTPYGTAWCLDLTPVREAEIDCTGVELEPPKGYVKACQRPAFRGLSEVWAIPEDRHCVHVFPPGSFMLKEA